MLVVSMEDMLRRTMGEHIQLEVDLQADAWLAYTDGHQLENALLNLVINARDAMPNGGRLGVHTENQRIEQHQPDAPEPGDYVVLCVTDNGAGMSAQTIAKAFDPFFTTKPIGRGTGLGLSMVYGFAKQTGGHVRIDSALGEGTRVTLYLPRNLSDDQAQPGPAQATDMPCQKWRDRTGGGGRSGGTHAGGGSTAGARLRCWKPAMRPVRCPTCTAISASICWSATSVCPGSTVGSWWKAPGSIDRN